jgi:hypothetical protein
LYNIIQNIEVDIETQGAICLLDEEYRSSEGGSRRLDKAFIEVIEEVLFNSLEL